MTKIISVHSYRGGTGKSNLVANLATLLVLQGKRVAIFDADIQSPGIHLPSMKSGEIAQVLSEGYDVELLHQGFQELSELLELDYLFVDTHPGISEEALLAIGVSDFTLVILRPDRQDYQGTAVVLDVAKQLEVSRLLLVVNKVLPEVDGDALSKKIEKTYQAQVAGVLPISNEMFRLASQGIFCLRYPNSSFTQKLNEITNKIESILSLERKKVGEIV